MTQRIRASTNAVTRPAAFVARLAFAIAGVAALVYAAACVYLNTQQRSLIFLPDASAGRTPAATGTAFRELSIPVGDRGVIDAWWLPSDSSESGATLLYLRGNDGNLGREVNRLNALRKQGLPILAIDYRGFGRSSGPAPSEAQVYDDATAAWDHLVNVQRVEPRRVLIYGHSLGGAVAAELALRRGPACGVLFEGAFTSMADMARLAYPMFPVEWLLTERFDTLDKVRRLDLPMLFVHGTADKEVPPAMSERLFEAARRDKQLVMVAGAGHEDAMPAGGAALSEAFARLVRGCGQQ
jgi:pimeloyl-ACP methyl ester carboxylesterase